MSDAVRSVVRTIFSAKLQTCQALKIPYDIPEMSTLNEAINLPDVVPYQPTPLTSGAQLAQSYNPETDSNGVSIQYWCIGNGGHNLVSTGSQGGPYPDEKPHRASNTGFYNQIPFVVKHIDQDLTREQRALYRLRKILLIDGEYYAAYYARKLPIQNVEPKLLHTKIQNGIATTTEFVPTLNNLNPPDPIIGQENDGSYLSVSSTMSIDFNAQDVAWLQEACELLYGTSKAAIISEIAICSGIDKPINQEYPLTGTQTSNNITNQGLMEAVGVQVNCFIIYFFSANYSNQGFSFDFDIGAAEPLFAGGR